MLLLAVLLAAPPLRYPLDFPPRVTAAFGTYRIGHHHAGLDLYTDGDETVPVRAAAAGRVVRIRRSAVGYGRAVYVNHADGKQTVYAHLSAFGPILGEAIAEATADASGYPFDVRLARGIPVAEGALLGWVGTAGTDLVHLHFEVRDRGPVNPLLNGLTIADAQPPRVRRLMAVPRHAGAHVGHTQDEAFFEFRDGALPAPVVIGGDVQLFAEVTDAIDGVRDDLIAAEVSLVIDDQPWHEVVYDRVAYGDKNQTELDFHPRLRAFGVGVFNRLREAVAPVRVQRRAGASLTTLRPGDHRARVTARDAAGKVTQATFVLRVEPARPPPGITLGPVPDGVPEVGVPATWRDTLVVQPLPADVQRVAVQVAGTPLAASLTTLEGQPAVAFDVSRKRSQRVRVGFVGPSGPARWITIESVALAPKKEAAVGVIRLTPDKDAFFLPYPTALQVLPAPVIAGAEVLSPLYRLTNGWLPTRGGTTMTVPWPEGAPPGGVGVYMIEGPKRWRVGSRVVDGRLIARVVHLGDFVVLRDVAPPVIGEPAVLAHPAGPRLIIPVDDADSGLRQVTLKLDGVVVPHEHQIAQRRIVFQPLPPGPHRVDVAATDREGRDAARSFNLGPPASAPPDARNK